MQVHAFPIIYKNACVAFFSLECIIMLLANALILFDDCTNPTNLQKCDARVRARTRMSHFCR